jgi:hypothetical protein
MDFQFALCHVQDGAKLEPPEISSLFLRLSKNVSNKTCTV